ncbi:hypothetical protein N7510_001361 [Penicillium lagena]|uniref:uncharacterized protein n=1 Tax=Penicillium lagena TaxID=94218 RepID=UPI002540D96D|nr:uncharacterized protein N7510_001361 [Penicillium lagena]KAJ5625052.1 hypothetical protein N7510_001361 [Penicillium lagena]
MPRMKVKTKAEDLARVRNNQRKCRARQKEYIHYLEQKVQHYETAQNAQLSDLQKKIDLLSVENQLLKYFVESITSMADFAFGTPLPLSYEACGAITGSERGFDLLLSPDYGNTSNLMPSAMGGLQGSSSIASNNESLRGGSMTTSNTCLPESLLFDDRALQCFELEGG